MSAVLPFCFTSPLNACGDVRISGIDIGDDPRSDRAKRVERFAARELHVFALKIASGDIVDARVAQHVTQRVFVSVMFRAVRPMTTPSSPSCSTCCDCRATQSDLHHQSPPTVL